MDAAFPAIFKTADLSFIAPDDFVVAITEKGGSR
jgi:hypothetical protein